MNPGTRIGQYEVLSTLGAGGMGEVYRATDARLKRQVALKILPPALSADADRLARLQREAEVLAALNHPHIAAIYGLEDSGGRTALVMELVEGDDLSQRIARGAIPLDEALPIARQVAAALEAAHEKGIIHRDLKPANIKVRADGDVKVLDFGLAKATESTGTSASVSMSPTITTPAMTEVGMILGTAAYMSPEQARGKTVDRRADIWAFGCVVYEMLSGTRPFAGEDVGDTLATVLKSEPDWNRLPAGTPGAIRTLLRRCLRKDPRQRLADAGAARIEIDDALAAPLADVVADPRRSRRAEALAALLVGVALVTAAAIVGARFGGNSTPQVRQDVARLVLPLAPGTELSDGPSVVISPDGKMVAFVATRGGVAELYTRSLDAADPHVVAGTRGAVGPFFSPDGQWLGFFALGKLKTVSIASGVVSTLADASPAGGSGTWSQDDTIVFSSPLGLIAIPASGGDARRLPVSGPEGPPGALRHPEFLPGGETLLIASNLGDASTAREVSIEALTIKTGRRKTLIQGSPYAHYLPTGHLVFLLDGTLRAAPLNLQTLELTAAPVEVLTGVRQQQYTGVGAFSCARTGSCVYIAGGTAASRTVAMVDRTGAVQSLAFPAKSYANPRLSPAGDKIALWVEQLRCDIEVFDLTRGTVTRLTSDGDNHYPVWTPDGRSITYLSQKTRSDGYDILSRAVNGSGAEEALVRKTSLPPTTPLAWSPGGVLAFVRRGDIWLLPPGGEPRAFEPSPFAETAPAFSPDGRWLAYVSDESGRNEVYVRPFPGPGEKYLISTAGGVEPVWSRNSRELFFRTGDQMLAVQVGTTTGFNASRPKVLFTGPFARAGSPNRINYDVSPDSERFVMLNSGEEDRAVTQISVLFNWFEELKARVPIR